MNIVSMNVPITDGKRGRIFARTQNGCDAAVERLKEIFEEDDDKERWTLLKALLEDSHVIARVHPCSDHELRDIMQIYLFATDDRREEHPLFACTMVARSRVDKDLESATDFFLETSTLQVIDSDEPLASSGSEDRIKIGLLAWFDRVFPKCVPPREIEIKPYNDATACGWAYAQYSDDEQWYGPCETREQAILEGSEECTEEPTFFIAQARWNKVDEGPDAERILEQLLDHLGDNYGDFAAEAVEARISPIARAELDEFLFRWQKKHLSQVYWTVDGAREKIERASVPALKLVLPSLRGTTLT